MKIKVIFLALTITATCVIFAPKVSSQEIVLSEFERQYQSYKLNIETYQKSHANYVLARAQYLRFQTLKSQDDAHSATVDMLQSRDQVTVSYLKTLRKRLGESEGVDEIKRDELYIKIDEEIGWYEDHKNALPSALTLQELIKDSNAAQKRYEMNAALFYEVLAHVSTGKLVRYQERMVKIFDEVKTRTNEIQAETREEYQLEEKKHGLIDQWALETQNRIDRTEQKRSEINETLLVMSDNTKAGRKAHDQVITQLSEMRQYLKEGSMFIREIVQEIITKN